MGLDMYILMEGDAIVEWRKSNQIHGWFVRRFPDLENDKPVTIDKNDILDLAEDIMECIEEIISFGDVGEVCKTRLPTVKGFFFGPTDYDYWYVEDLFDSLKKVMKCAYKMTKCPDAKFTYVAWW